MNCENVRVCVRRSDGEHHDDGEDSFQQGTDADHVHEPVALLRDNVLTQPVHLWVEDTQKIGKKKTANTQ